jgi:hypothetical protein
MRLTARHAMVLPALLAACGTAPRVEIVEAVPVATIGAEQEWALIVRVHNPKDEQLVLDGIGPARSTTLADFYAARLAEMRTRFTELKALAK